MASIVWLAPAVTPATEAGDDPLLPPFGAELIVDFDLALSPYSEGSDDQQEVFRAFALGLHAGRRWHRWGVGLAVEGTLWRTLDGRGEDDWFGALHTGLEGSVLSAGGRIRTRVGGGLALLLEGTALDSAGGAGFYVDLRPAGLRWALDDAVVGFDPLTLFMTLPDAGGIPLVDVQYRLCIYAEFGR